MLADPRAEALTTNFASQWLYLRNLAAAVPNLRLYPDFDDNLRQAFRRETELFFESIVQDDRSVLDAARRGLHLPERTARAGTTASRTSTATGSAASRCRPTASAAGCSGHGSILTVTSHSTRTSPVRRGKWILENILGMPPPPPPANVPPLKENGSGGRREDDARADGRASQQPGVRGMPSQHRSAWPCARELRRRRPLADARRRRVGDRRVREACPAAKPFDGVAGLRQALLARPDVFVGDADREAADVRAGPRRRPTATRPRCGRSVARPLPMTTASRARRRAIVRSAPFQMRRAGEARDYDGGRRAVSGLELGLEAGTGRVSSPSLQSPVPNQEMTAMMLRKMALPRRTFLRGMRAAVALPLLDAMVPALTAMAQTRRAAGPPARVRLHPDGHEPGAVDAARPRGASPSCRRRWHRSRRISIT